MRISDWSSVVCSSDLKGLRLLRFGGLARDGRGCGSLVLVVGADDGVSGDFLFDLDGHDAVPGVLACVWGGGGCRGWPGAGPHPNPSPASQERGFGALLLPGNLAGGLLGAGLFRRGLPGCLARGSLLRCLARCGLLRGLPCRCLLGGLAWRGLFRRGLLHGLARSGLLRGFLLRGLLGGALLLQRGGFGLRSEEHTSELQSLMRISYAVFCLKKKNQTRKTNNNTNH